jgi:hypothetical protein
MIHYDANGFRDFRWDDDDNDTLEAGPIYLHNRHKSFSTFTTPDISIEKIREAIECLKAPARCLLCMKSDFENIKAAIGPKLFGINLIMVPDGCLEPNHVAIVEGEFAERLQDALDIRRTLNFGPIEIREIPS